MCCVHIRTYFQMEGIALEKHMFFKVKSAETNTKCIARIEERLASEEVQQTFKALCKITGNEFHPVMEKYIIWEKIQGNIEKIQDVNIRDIVTMFVVHGITEGTSEHKLAEHVVDFYNTISGPVIKTSNNEISLNELYAYICTYYMTVSLFKASVEKSLESGYTVVDRQLTAPIKDAIRRYPGYKGKWDVIDVIDGEPFFVPHNPKSKELRFIVTPPPKGIDDNRSIKEKWAKSVTIHNINNILKRKILYTVLLNNKTDKPEITVLPQDIYTSALLEVINSTKEVRECDCGCGKMSPVNSEGNAWHSDKCLRKANIKQQVITYFRTQKHRGKISEEQFKKIKRVAIELKEANEEISKDELMSKIKSFLDNEYKKGVKRNAKKEENR